MDIVAELNAHEIKFAPLRDKWLKYHDMYEGKVMGKIAQKTTSKVSLGQGYSIIEQAKAQALSQQPRFQFKSRRNENYEELRKYNEFLQYQMDKNEAVGTIEDIYTWAAVTGLAGWKVGWEFKTSEETVREAGGMVVTNPLLYPISKKKKKEKRDGNWTLQYVKPFDLLWNTGATGTNNLSMIAHRQTMTIKDMEAFGIKTKELKDKVLSNASYWDTKLDPYHTEDASQRKEGMLNAMSFNVYETYYTEMEGEKRVEKIAFVVGGDGLSDGKMVVEDTENNFDGQFKPMGILRLVKKPGKFYGIGLLEPVEGILQAEEDMFNLNLESVMTDTMRPMEYNPENVLDPQGISYGPRKLIAVRRIGESVAPLPTPKIDVGAASFTLGYLEKNKQNVTAITDYQTGADRLSTSKTATEIKLKTAQSEQRSNKMIISMERELLTPLGKMVLSLNKQFLAEEEDIEYQVSGKDGILKNKKLKFADIDGIEDVQVVRGSTAMVEQEKQKEKYMALLELALTMQQAGIQMNTRHILNSLLEQGLDIDSPEHYLPSDKTAEAEQVGGKMNEMEKAKQENENPETAKVLPTDDHEIHIKIHQADLKTPYPPDIKAMKLKHLNEHVELSGGMPAQQQNEGTPQIPTEQGVNINQQPNE